MILLLIALLFPPTLYLLIYLQFSKNIFTSKTVESSEFALVFGAGLEKDASPTDILQDRINIAINLLMTNKVNKLVMSGSSTSGSISEPQAMLQNTIKAGIPKSKIILDEKGNSTFESLINFSREYLDKKVILITQKYHLPRALLLGRMLHIDAQGCVANSINFSTLRTTLWTIRELIALPYNLIKYLIYKMKVMFS